MIKLILLIINNMKIVDKGFLIILKV